jgi:hypothetical protein
MNRKKTDADHVRCGLRRASRLYTGLKPIDGLEADDLAALADQVDDVASGLVGAAARLRRLAKQRKKSGVAGAVHDTRK